MRSEQQVSDRDEREPDGDVTVVVLSGGQSRRFGSDKLAAPLDHYLLADRRGDVMAARTRLRELLGRMA